MFKRFRYTIIFFLLSLSTQAGKESNSAGINLLRNNISPSKGMFGISLGAIVPMGGNGQVFSTNSDFPHADYGMLAGIDFWKRNIHAFDFHIGLIGKYQRYHFHYTPTNLSELSGYFSLWYYSLPISIHVPIPRFPYFQLMGGVAISSLNLYPSYTGTLGPYTYTSAIDLNWVVAPELFIGLNFLEEKTDYFILRGSAVYSAFTFRNQDYDITMTDGISTYSSKRAMPSGKVEVVLTLYPKWKFKKSMNKNDAINCPAPF